MDTKQITFKEGASLNRPPLFEGQHFSFWQNRMQIFIQSVDPGAWNAIINGPFIAERVDEHGNRRVLEWDEMTDAEKRKTQYDLKAKNMITSGLSSDEFFRTVRCKSAKEIWEMLEVTHEGTEDVRRSRKHALIHEYELIKMNPDETIAQFQTRFTHVINHLLGLGKTFDEDELNIKVLKSLPSRWLPKVTAIRESKDLSKMTLAALFGKLLEHESEINNSSSVDEFDRKKKSIALKATSSKEDESESSSNEEEDENLAMVVKRFRRFLKKKKGKRPPRAEKRPEPNSKEYTCFECGRKGHIKTDCPTFLKKQLLEKKGRTEKKGKKAYVVWDQKESSSTSSSSSSEAEANLCLMANKDEGSSESSESDDTFSQVSSTDQYLVDAFNEMHQEAQKLAVSNNRLKSTVKYQTDKLLSLQKDFNKLKDEHDTLLKSIEVSGCTCSNSLNKIDKLHDLQLEFDAFKKDHNQKRVSLESEIAFYKSLLHKAYKGKMSLNEILAVQKISGDRAGLGYVAGTSKTGPNHATRFVKSRNQMHQRQGKIICHYCMEHGHTNFNCYMRKYLVPQGAYVWRPKAAVERLSNIKGPKLTWVPASHH